VKTLKLDGTKFSYKIEMSNWCLMGVLVIFKIKMYMNLPATFGDGIGHDFGP
jgi:hypothetical protein